MKVLATCYDDVKEFYPENFHEVKDERLFSPLYKFATA